MVLQTHFKTLGESEALLRPNVHSQLTGQLRVGEGGGAKKTTGTEEGSAY